MNSAPTASSGPGRERLIVLTAIAGLVAISWLYVVYLAQDMSDMSAMAPDMGAMAQEMGDLRSWSAADLLLLFLMWSVMMIGMMLPSAIPLILNFEAENRARGENVLVRTAALSLGYVATWTAFSIGATLLQWGLHSAALLSPMMVSTNSTLSGVILVAAGVYQLTPVKYNLLKRCRNPLHRLRLNWLDGTGGAFVMGLEHGSYCLGCCIVLMGLLFAFGVMNLLLLALVALFILVEKVFPFGHIAGIVSGPLMIATGGYILFVQ